MIIFRSVSSKILDPSAKISRSFQRLKGDNYTNFIRKINVE